MKSIVGNNVFIESASNITTASIDIKGDKSLLMFFKTIHKKSAAIINEIILIID